MIGIFAAEGPNGNWIPGDPNELYWGSAAFLIIAVVFVMKGVPAIKAAMKATSAKVEGELAEAEQAKAEAEAELEALTSSLGDAGAEAEAIIADAREQATRLEADLIARAENDVESLSADYGSPSPTGYCSMSRPTIWMLSPLPGSSAFLRALVAPWWRSLTTGIFWITQQVGFWNSTAAAVFLMKAITPRGLRQKKNDSNRSSEPRLPTRKQ